MNDATALRIAVMAKAPVPGDVKTRLIPALGAKRAARLHAAMVRHTLATIRSAGFQSVTLWCAPDDRHPFFATCRGTFDVALGIQPEGDLGSRMARVFEEGSPALLLGSDCPSITAALVLACAEAIVTGVDAVFLPAEDGGYGLIGLVRPTPDVFAGIAWSTATVMAQTRERLGALRLKHAEPAMIWDVDEPADVARLDASGLIERSAWD